jgi:hypothetical protein
MFWFAVVRLPTAKLYTEIVGDGTNAEFESVMIAQLQPAKRLIKLADKPISPTPAEPSAEDDRDEDRKPSAPPRKPSRK